MKKESVVIGISFLAACLAFVIRAKSVQEIQETIEAPKETVLNKYLSNALSDTSSLEKMDKKILAFMQQWQVKGLSLGIMRNDSLVYAKGYGWADQEREKEMEPSNLLRLASVSKLITATGIMRLKEDSLLTLSDKVFGEDGILGQEAYCSSIKDKNYYKITVEDLLRHKGGFTTGAGDPMFSTRTVMANNGLKDAPDNDKLIECVLKRRLGYMPGSSQSYSNFGYLLLSKVIEKKSGMSYEDFIQKEVFKPAGIHDFHLANNYYNERHSGEVRYYVPSNEELVQEYNNSGKSVVRCYGGNDIHALSGAGAWVGSVPELMKFVAAIDGKPEIQDIISEDSVREMTAYKDEVGYSLGWNDTKPSSGWKRSGSFSGTSAMIHYFPDGECWIMVTNTSTWKGSRFSPLMAALFAELRKTCSPLLPQRDFFHE